jgi:hypothetical protein
MFSNASRIQMTQTRSRDSNLQSDHLKILPQLPTTSPSAAYRANDIKSYRISSRTTLKISPANKSTNQSTTRASRARKGEGWEGKEARTRRGCRSSWPAPWGKIRSPSRSHLCFPQIVPVSPPCFRQQITETSAAPLMGADSSCREPLVFGSGGTLSLSLSLVFSPVSLALLFSFRNILRPLLFVSCSLFMADRVYLDPDCSW